MKRGFKYSHCLQEDSLLDENTLKYEKIMFLPKNSSHSNLLSKIIISTKNFDSISFILKLVNKKYCNDSLD